MKSNRGIGLELIPISLAVVFVALVVSFMVYDGTGSWGFAVATFAIELFIAVPVLWALFREPGF